MPRLSATVTTTTETTLDVQLQARLRALLSTSHPLKTDYDLIKGQMEEEVAKMKAILDDEQVQKVVLDGVPLTIVGGESSSLDKLKFVELGGSLEMLANATVKKPKKKYLRIGGEKEE